MAAKTVLLYTWIGSLILSIVLLVISIAMVDPNQSLATGKAELICYLLSGLMGLVFVVTLIAWLVVRGQDTSESKSVTANEPRALPSQMSS